MRNNEHASIPNKVRKTLAGVGVVALAFSTLGAKNSQVENSASTTSYEGVGLNAETIIDIDGIDNDEVTTNVTVNKTFARVSAPEGVNLPQVTQPTNEQVSSSEQNHVQTQGPQGYIDMHPGQSKDYPTPSEANMGFHDRDQYGPEQPASPAQPTQPIR